MERHFSQNKLGILYTIRSIPELRRDFLEWITWVNKERDLKKSWKTEEERKASENAKKQRKRKTRPDRETPDVKVLCKTCGKWFPYTAEYFYRSCKTVLSSRCIECAREYSKEYYEVAVRTKRGHRTRYNKNNKKEE